MAPNLSEQETNSLKKKLRARFLQVREEIRQELLRSDNEQYIDLAGRVHDPEEESVADLLADVNLAAIGRHIQEIRDIDAALMRIVDGTYGTCIDCEAPIRWERLSIYPTAKRCQPCQTRHEETRIPGRSTNL